MTENAALADFKQGMQLLRDRKSHDALIHFRKAAEVEEKNPYYMSFTGLALARAENKWAPALKLCETALSMKRNEVQLHLNLAEVYTSAGRREEALMTLDRAAASFGRHAGIQRARLKLGSRRPPVFSLLSRDNVVNKQMGVWRQRLLDWAEGTRLPLLRSS
jgi:Flp pilus assembly protein TadD